MNACIFVNEELDFQPSLASGCGDCVPCDYIIAADGGARQCLKLGIRPDLIIGEVDTIDSPMESGLAGIEKISISKGNDATDTEYAISEALKRKYSQVTIVGGVGGRIDHTIGNLALIAKYAGKVAMVTKDGLLLGLSSSHVCKLNGPAGSIVSIVAWGESAKIQTRGLKNFKNDEVLEIAISGISNEISESSSSIYVIAGTILLFIEKNIRFCFTHNDKTSSNPTGYFSV